MKSWFPLAVVVGLFALVLAFRHAMRETVTSWMAQRLGASARAARAKAVLWLGAMTAAAVVALAGAAAGLAVGGWWADVRYVVVPAVFVLYLPVATMGSPRLTRWQKDFGWRLHEAGATRESAVAFARVARVVSGVAVAVAVAGVGLIAYHAA